MKICALYSGSSGNSIFLSSKTENEVNSFSSYLQAGFRSETNLLVDAGMSGKKLQIAMNEIGENLDNIDGLLITHEHIDHMKGVGVIMRRHKIPVYVNQKTWDKISKMAIGNIPENLINIVKSNSEFLIGDLKINSFSTPHDAVDSSGYKITYQDKKVCVFTDIGEITDELLLNVNGSDAVFIESNYDTKMLWEGNYPYMLKKRIDGLNGHLSNEECSKAVMKLLKSGTTRFVLSHLSQENNLPSVAMKATKSELKKEGAIIGKDLEVQVAMRSCVSTPWII